MQLILKTHNFLLIVLHFTTNYDLEVMTVVSVW